MTHGILETRQNVAKWQINFEKCKWTKKISESTIEKVKMSKCQRTHGILPPWKQNIF